MALMVMGILFIGEVMLNSIREDKKFTESVINTTSVLAFKKIGNEVSESAGASVEFFHLPIPYACGSSIQNPCVRKYDPATQQFRPASQVPTAVNYPGVAAPNTVSNIEFFRDETSDSNGQIPAIGVDPATPGLVKLKDFPLIVPIPNQTEELYVTWVLEQGTDLVLNNKSPNPFMLLRYSKDTRYFSIDPASGKDIPLSEYALFMPSPPIDPNDAQTLANYADRPFLVTSAEDNTKFFIAETTSSISHCGVSSPAQSCIDAWSDANPLQVPTPPTTYPATAVDTVLGHNKSDALVAMKLSPISTSSLASYFSPALATQTLTATPPPVSSFTPGTNIFAFPTQHASYFDASGVDTGAPYTFGSTSPIQANLIQKLEKKLYPGDNLVAAPVEISSIYLERKKECVAKTTPPTACSRLMMKTYKSPLPPMMLLDEVSNGGFILITRQLGKSELSFRIYNQPLNTVISSQ